MRSGGRAHDSLYMPSGFACQQSIQHSGTAFTIHLGAAEAAYGFKVCGEGGGDGGGE